MQIKKSFSLIIVLIMILSFSACQAESNISNETSEFIAKTTSDVSSVTQKIYKPKTKYESVQLWEEGYDLIERMPPENVTDLSKSEFIKCVEKIYEITLPNTTSFKSGGKIRFDYEVYNKYEYAYTNFGVSINKLVTHYNQKNIDSILKQLNAAENRWKDCTESLYYLFDFNEDNIKEVVGDYSNKEYFIYVNYASPMITVDHTMNRYIFFMKEDNSDDYIVIFDGIANNYELQNGTLEVQSDGSAKVIS